MCLLLYERSLSARLWSGHVVPIAFGADVPIGDLYWATWAAVEKEYKAHKEAARNGVVQEEYGGKDYPDVYDAYSYLDEEGDGDEMEESDDEADEADVDEAYSADMRWPTKCFHKESFFGYAYDAGEHALREYSFLFHLQYIDT